MLEQVFAVEGEDDDEGVNFSMDKKLTRRLSYNLRRTKTKEFRLNSKQMDMSGI